MKRLGLIVNPVAGIGGRVGLKGSDGAEIVARALALGAVPEAPQRAVDALGQMTSLIGQVEVLTYGGAMGEAEARACGWTPTIVGTPPGEATTRDDTTTAARAMADAGVDLLLFAGGDGTARDIHAAIDSRVTVLGIPAGVKIHSAAFAVTPRSAGQLAALFLTDRVTDVREAEVMDIDEEAFRAGRVSAALYGMVNVPADPVRTQAMKSGGIGSEQGGQGEIAAKIMDDLQPGDTCIIGPGTTTRRVKEEFGVTPALLGVDVVRDGQLVAGDATEAQLLAILDDVPPGHAWIVVTIIGGQGYIFGRGNQQISPRVIARVGRDHIRVIATQAKLLALRGRPLLVDTGDPDLDASLSGYIRVLVGYNDEVLMRVASSPV